MGHKAPGRSARTVRLTAAQMRDATGATENQLRNLRRSGMPHRSSGGRVTYPLDSLRWYLERVTAQSGSDDKRRREKAEADLAEIRAHRERGELIAIDDSVAEVRRFCERARAGILSMRSRHQASIVNLQTIAEAGVALDRIAAALLTDLQRDAGGAHEAAAGVAPPREGELDEGVPA